MSLIYFSISDSRVLTEFNNSFVDRDMAMRYYFGLGVGHAYSHHASLPHLRGLDNESSEIGSSVLLPPAAVRISTTASSDTQSQVEDDQEEACDLDAGSGSDSNSQSDSEDNEDFNDTDDEDDKNERLDDEDEAELIAEEMYYV